MRNGYRPASLWLVFVLWTGLLPTSAGAAVPLAEHLLTLVGERLGDPAPAVIRRVHIRKKPSAEEGDIQSGEVVYLRFPGSIRVERVVEDGTRVVLQRDGRRLVVDRGRILPDPLDPMEIALRPLVQNRIDGLVQVLSEAGVDTAVTSLGRFNGRLGYVLGARYPDESVPQIWFDKETLLPFRWLMIQPAADGSYRRTEIRYFAWEKTGDLQFPRSMECYRGDQLVSEVRVTEVETPAAVPETLFSIYHLLEQAADRRRPAADSRQPVAPVQ